MKLVCNVSLASKIIVSMFVLKLIYYMKQTFIFQAHSTKSKKLKKMMMVMSMTMMMMMVMMMMTMTTMMTMMNLMKKN